MTACCRVLCLQDLLALINQYDTAGTTIEVEMVDAADGAAADGDEEGEDEDDDKEGDGGQQQQQQAPEGQGSTAGTGAGMQQGMQDLSLKQ
jgi:hypothetical protein